VLAERGGGLRDVVLATVVAALLDPRLLVEVQAIAVVRGGEAA
jgi:hypothetical protein